MAHFWQWAAGDVIDFKVGQSCGEGRARDLNNLAQLLKATNRLEAYIQNPVSFKRLWVSTGFFRSTARSNCENREEHVSTTPGSTLTTLVFPPSVLSRTSST